MYRYGHIQRYNVRAQGVHLAGRALQKMLRSLNVQRHRIARQGPANAQDARARRNQANVSIAVV